MWACSLLVDVWEETFTTKHINEDVCRKSHSITSKACPKYSFMKYVTFWQISWCINYGLTLNIFISLRIIYCIDSALQLRSKPQSQLTDSNFRSNPESIMIQHNMWIRDIFQPKPVKILIISTMQDPFPFMLSYYHISYHQKYYNSGTHRTMKSFYIDSEGCITVRETKENKLCKQQGGKQYMRTSYTKLLPISCIASRGIKTIKQ